MNRFLRRTLLAGALCLPAAAVTQAPSPAEAGDKEHGAKVKSVVTEGKDLKWGPGPAALPPGAQAVVLDGDPSKKGPFTMRAKVPANYRIAPHHHPEDERVTVLSGTARIGMGERFDETKLTSLGAGGYFMMPKGHRHFFTTTEETVIQLNGMGPWDIIYVNPADDPRQQKAPARGARTSSP